MQQIFLCAHADILCTDPDINFTEERERTHMHAKEKMRGGESLSSHLGFFLPLCMYDNFSMYR